jgi:hypothetical protein
MAAAPPDVSWDIALQTSPVEFYPRFGPIPGVTGVRSQPPTWDTAGFTRTLALSDGGSVVETVTDSTRGVFFAYDLSDFARPLGFLVAGGRAEWAFTTDGDGTRIHWSYAFYPLPGRAWAVGLIVRIFWSRYMRRVLTRITATIDHRDR